MEPLHLAPLRGHGAPRPQQGRQHLRGHLTLRPAAGDPASRAEPSSAPRPRAFTAAARPTAPPQSPDAAGGDPAAASSAPGPRAGLAPRAKWKSDRQAPESPPASSTPSERSQTSFPDESADDAPCSDEPHCKNWKKRHGHLAEERQLEYKFLYAASAGCVQCMQCYASLPDFNVDCESTEMNAREWAEEADQLSPQMEGLLRRLGL